MWGAAGSTGAAEDTSRGMPDSDGDLDDGAIQTGADGRLGANGSAFASEKTPTKNATTAKRRSPRRKPGPRRALLGCEACYENQTTKMARSS